MSTSSRGSNSPAQKMRSSPISISSSGSSPPAQRIRSSPIAIPDNDLEDAMGNMTVGSVPTYRKQHVIPRSMPVPRAPYLTSSRRQGAQDAQPPAMYLSSAAVDTRTSSEKLTYGSLRESHLQGRFLDGPASYRDASSGRIYATRQRVRFDDSATSYQQKESFMGGTTLKIEESPRSPPVNIGERMQKAREKQQQQQSSHSPTSGGLSAMMENAQDSTVQKKEVRFQRQEQMQQQQPISMLSTSLTGFEVLQSGGIDQFPIQQDLIIETVPPIEGSLPIQREDEHPQQQQEHEEEIDPPEQQLQHTEDDYAYRPSSPIDNPDTEEAFDLDLDD